MKKITVEEFKRAKKASLEKWESAPIDGGMYDADEWWFTVGGNRCPFCDLRTQTAEKSWCKNGCPIRDTQDVVCCRRWDELLDYMEHTPTENFSMEHFAKEVNEMHKQISAVKFSDIPSYWREDK